MHVTDITDITLLIIKHDISLIRQLRLNNTKHYVQLVQVYSYVIDSFEKKKINESLLRFVKIVSMNMNTKIKARS